MTLFEANGHVRSDALAVNSYGMTHVDTSSAPTLTLQSSQRFAGCSKRCGLAKRPSA